MLTLAKALTLTLSAAFAAVFTPPPLHAQNDIWARSWTELDGSTLAEAFSGVEFFRENGVAEDQTAVWRQPMPWNPGHFLYRFSGGWEPENLYFYFVRKPDGTFVQLDGRSPVIHQMNAVSAPLLNTETVAQYLWFFTFFVRGAEGPFVLAESGDDTFVPAGPFSGATFAQGVVSVEETFKPVLCRQEAESDVFLCSATVIYSDAVFEAEFAVLPSGMIEMTGDQSLATGLPVKVSAPISIAEVGEDFRPRTPNRALFSKPSTPSPTPEPQAAAPHVAEPQPPEPQAAAPAPTVQRPPDIVEQMRGQIDPPLLATLAALTEGRTVSLDHTNQPFLAGMASSMMESCGMPRDRATRLKLGGFVASSAIGAIGGVDYSNPDIGASVGSAARQQSLLAMGVLVTQTMGCSPGLDRLGMNIARLVAANAAAGSVFVNTCTPSFDRRRCECLADIGRQVIPEIRNRAYSRDIIRTIIQRNPFIGLTIGISCQIGNY